LSGISLSGGQRQHTAIARAVVAKKSLILILDEATSSLDSESEKLVQEAIERIIKDSTAIVIVIVIVIAIVIAHRLSTVMHADKIIVLNNGQIEAIGQHEELLKTSSTYKRLCYLQFNSYNQLAQ